MMKKRMIILFFVMTLGMIVLNIYNFNINKDDGGTLYHLIHPIVENTSIKDGDCLSYTIYYQDYIKKIYPELDIRKIDRAGICPIGTKECGEWEGIPHTYLIINGYGGECILDQHNLVCIQVVDE